MENINLNQSQCIKERHQLTGVTYVNVCSNTQTFVNYGTLDILTGITFALLMGICFVLMGKIVKEMF